LTAIFLDDLHFADEASVDFMRQLAASGSLIWGLAFRGAELSDASRSLVDALASVCATEMICLQVSREGQAHEPLA
jgi:predicted ATPase